MDIKRKPGTSAAPRKTRNLHTNTLDQHPGLGTTQYGGGFSGGGKLGPPLIVVPPPIETSSINTSSALL